MNEIFRISIDDLPFGLSFHNQRNLIVYRSSAGKIRALRNRCRHQGGQFLTDNCKSRCILRCPNHDWVLDVENMEYINPAGGLKHIELRTSVVDGALIIWEEEPDRPWEMALQEHHTLEPNELTLRFFAHACMEVNLGRTRIFTDPWLEGPAFSLGWWLLHEPPENWLDCLANADGIYISHNHSDHLNIHTLQHLVKRNPDIPFFVPDFSSGSCTIPLRRLGFTNVQPSFNKWIELGRDARLMILPDATGRDDSGVLFEYKGHRILNTVDCANLNNGVLPQSVDVLLNSFASGASGFPVCWGEMYSREKISKMVDRDRGLIMKEILLNAEKTKPRFLVPFAGYFVEAHHADADVRELNVKNTADDVEAFFQRHAPSVQVWKPRSGQMFDVSNGQANQCPMGIRPLQSQPVARYQREVIEEATFAPLENLRNIERFFAWTGFKGNLVLHILETDSTFTNVVREFYYDFQSCMLVEGRPDREHQYTRLKIRSAPFRSVVRRGMPWEELSIGFQIRFYREPDVYEFDFWNHFQNYLPGPLLDDFWQS